MKLGGLLVATAMAMAPVTSSADPAPTWGSRSTSTHQPSGGTSSRGDYRPSSYRGDSHRDSGRDSYRSRGDYHGDRHQPRRDYRDGGYRGHSSDGYRGSADRYGHGGSHGRYGGYARGGFAGGYFGRGALAYAPAWPSRYAGAFSPYRPVYSGWGWGAVVPVAVRYPVYRGGAWASPYGPVSGYRPAYRPSSRHDGYRGWGRQDYRSYSPDRR